MPPLKLWTISAACCVAVVSFGNRLHAAVYFVDDSAFAGSQSGLTWEDAFLDLQIALGIAQAGDEIRIGQGTYRPAEPFGLQSISFALPAGVVLTGGFSGYGATDPDDWNPESFPTILSGDLNGDDAPDFVNDAENSWHVVSIDGANIDASTQIRGVTITAGRADGDRGESDPHNRGGGLVLRNGASPTVEHCIIENNRANYFGGGMDGGSGNPVINQCVFRSNQLLNAPTAAGAGLRALGQPVITDCVFQDNRDCCFTGSGGGVNVNNITLSGCLFIGNLAENGSGVFGSSLVLRDCDFIGNEGTTTLATFNATLFDCRFIANHNEFAAVVVKPGGQFTAVGCEFALNEGQLGNAIWNLGTGRLINTAFLRNANDPLAPTVTAGAIFNDGNLLAINCLFAGNDTRGIGGAIESHGSLNLVNCTVVGNTAQGSGSLATAAIHVAGGVASIRNSLLWQNRCRDDQSESAQIFGPPGAGDDWLDIARCHVQGWTGSLGSGDAGSGNVGSDPLFIDAAGLDKVFGTADDDARLTTDSSARDTGECAALWNDEFDLDDDAVLGELIPRDLDSLRRVAALAVDRGAFEFQLPCPADIVPPGTGPAFGDGHVNVDDLLAVVNSWGSCGSPPDPCPADITGDDAVNVDDLLAVINAWGVCDSASPSTPLRTAAR